MQNQHPQACRVPSMLPGVSSLRAALKEYAGNSNMSEILVELTRIKAPNLSRIVQLDHRTALASHVCTRRNRTHDPNGDVRVLTLNTDRYFTKTGSPLSPWAQVSYNFQRQQGFGRKPRPHGRTT
jgi:hypothetical protein